MTERFEVEVGGRRLEVGVTTSDTGIRVALDGRAIDVDVARIDAQTLSLLCDTRSFEAVVTPDPGSPSHYTVRVAGVPVMVAVNGFRRRSRKEEHGGSASTPQRVTAPMPGKIVRVLVKTGDAVRARQPLVVVEAMKMENELRAARDGTISDVSAREGESVDAGALLVLVQ